MDSIHQAETGSEVDRDEISFAEAFADPEIDVSPTRITHITAPFAPFGGCCG